MFDTLETCAGTDKFICGPSFEFGPDADIAGAGVVWSLTIAAGFSLFIAWVDLYSECRYYFGKRQERKRGEKDKRFLDPFLVSLSDTQIITSLALLIVTCFRVGCTISAYHYDLVCSLVLVSSATHVGSILVLHEYFGQNLWLGAARCALTVVNFAFAWILFIRRIASHVFPSYTPNSTVSNNGTFSTGLSLPAACFLSHKNAPDSGYPKNFTSSPSWFPWMSNATQTPSNTSQTLWNITQTALNATDDNTFPSVNSSSLVPGRTNITWPTFEQFSSDDNLTNVPDLVVLGFVTLCFLLTLATSVYLYNPHQSKQTRHQTAFYIRCFSYLITSISTIYGIARLFNLRNWMSNSKLFGDDKSEEEFDSFGQWMPLILLVLPLLALLEQSVDTIRKHSSKKQDD